MKQYIDRKAEACLTAEKILRKIYPESWNEDQIEVHMMRTYNIGSKPVIKYLQKLCSVGEVIYNQTDKSYKWAIEPKQIDNQKDEDGNNGLAGCKSDTESEQSGDQED